MGKPQTDWDGPSWGEFFSDTVKAAVVTYVQWYKENGLHLPEDFARNPSGWTDLLNTFAEELEANGEFSPETGRLFVQYGEHLFKKNHEEYE